MYGVFLVMVLVITGGAIAFIGDRLGSRVGKKRMSIFGLRPKHTSILVTIVTGILITTTTLGIMALVSENVRTALFGMEKLNQNMAEARIQLQKTAEDLDMATDELNKANQEKQRATENLQQTKQELSALQEQQSVLEQRAEELQEGNRQLEEAKNELMVKNDDLTISNKKLVKSRSELQAGNKKLQDENKNLDEKNKYLSTGIQIMREGDITFRAGEVLASGIVDGNRSVDAVGNDLKQLVTVARNNVANRLGSDAKDIEKDIWIYQPEYEEAEKYISTSKNDIVVRIVAAGNMVRGEPIRTYLQLYKNTVVYNDGELVATKSINLEKKDSENIQMALGSFLHEVNQNATAKGMLVDPISGTVGRIDAEQVFDVMRRLAMVKGPSAIISAFAKGVADVLGPLQITLKVFGTGENTTE